MPPWHMYVNCRAFCICVFDKTISSSTKSWVNVIAWNEYDQMWLIRCRRLCFAIRNIRNASVALSLDASFLCDWMNLKWETSETEKEKRKKEDWLRMQLNENKQTQNNSINSSSDKLNNKHIRIKGKTSFLRCLIVIETELKGKHRHQTFFDKKENHLKMFPFRSQFSILNSVHSMELNFDLGKAKRQA